MTLFEQLKATIADGISSVFPELAHANFKRYLEKNPVPESPIPYPSHLTDTHFASTKDYNQPLEIQWTSTEGRTLCGSGQRVLAADGETYILTTTHILDKGVQSAITEEYVGKIDHKDIIILAKKRFLEIDCLELPVLVKEQRLLDTGYSINELTDTLFHPVVLPGVQYKHNIHYGFNRYHGATSGVRDVSLDFHDPAAVRKGDSGSSLLRPVRTERRDLYIVTHVMFAYETRGDKEQSSLAWEIRPVFDEAGKVTGYNSVPARFLPDEENGREVMRYQPLEIRSKSKNVEDILEQLQQILERMSNRE